MTSSYRTRLESLAVAAILLLLAATPAAAQRGAYTRPRNMAELVSQSAVIVRGVVVSAKVEPHPELTHLSTVVVTLRVAETLKGDAAGTFTFRQFIWDLRDRHDAAGYRKGQQLLLLMNPVTRYGLTSPAGLEQGRFRISRDAAGREIAVNGYGNAGLLRNLAEELKSRRVQVSPRLATLIEQHQSGPVSFDDLRDLTGQLNALHLR
jgi:hypothetical protein